MARLMLLLLLSLLAAARGSNAQETTAPTPTNGANAQADPSRLPPMFTDYEEFLAWKKSRPRTDEPSVTSVVLEGETQDDRAELTATIDVQVNTEDTWVAVPLRMPEATLKAPPTYEGPGETVPDNSSVERGEGYQWWFRGKGLHRLTMPLIVPIQKQLPSRSLRLTVPLTAVQQLKLRVPVQADQLSVLQAPPGLALQKSEIDASTSLIELIGPVQKLSLTWQLLPASKANEAILDVNTEFTFDIRSGMMMLTATQKVVPQQGPFKELRVVLPSRFELLDVVGNPSLQSYNVIRAANSPKQVDMKFNEPLEQPLELRWKFRPTAVPEDMTTLIDGLAVPGAQTQVGTILLGTSNGYRIDPPNDPQGPVHRIDPIREKPGMTAFSFVTQPFSLALSIQPIEPQYEAVPRYTLRFSPTEVDLDAQITVNVYRGALEAIDLDWPQWREQGWKLRQIGVAQQVQSDEQTETGMRLILGEPQVGTFTLPIRAVREISAGKPFNLMLPHPPQSNSASELLVESPNNLLVTLPMESSPADPDPAEEASSSTSRTELYRVDPSAADLTATVTQHGQEIVADTELALATASLANTKQEFQVRQRILVEVKYEPLSELRLRVPEAALQGQLRLVDATGKSLSRVTPGRNGGGEYIVSLEKPELGRVEVVAQYSVPVDVDAAAVALPRIDVVDHPFESVTLQVAPTSTLEIAPDGGSWERQPSEDQSIVWRTAEPALETSLRVNPMPRSEAQTFRARRALVRTALRPNGTITGQVSYRLEGVPAKIDLVVPDGITVDTVWWNGTMLPDAVSATGIRATLPAADVPGGVLAVDFRSTENGFGWTDAHALQCPHFGDGVWVEKTLWQVSLPLDQHLFTVPGDYSPEFRWRRTALTWSRQPTPASADLAAWLGVEGAPPARKELAGGNSYCFSRFASPATLEFRSMGRSLVVLFGAGVALAAGFLLLKFPVTRNAMTALVAAFVLALLSLWYSAPMQLLVQPALFGLVLAIIAASIDTYLKREDGAAELGPVSNYLRSPSSRMEAALYVGDGDRSGSARNAPTPPAEPVSASDSGQRL